MREYLDNSKWESEIGETCSTLGIIRSAYKMTVITYNFNSERALEKPQYRYVVNIKKISLKNGI